MKFTFGTNWKMRNLGRDEAREYVRVVAASLPRLANTRIFILPPVTLIRDMALEAAENRILIGAQNFHWAPEGEFTGEISTALLKQEGAAIVMVGHAERRSLFGESDQVINRKLKRALADGLQVVLCVGDSEPDLAAAKLQETFFRQIGIALDGVAPDASGKLIVAYEPVWAIGEAAKGAPSGEQVTSCVDLIRRALQRAFGGAADEIPVLYGGSVGPGNCRQFVAGTGVNGLFVGRSARDPHRFVLLIQEALSVMEKKTPNAPP
ncbi:MAG: triosephosphate isomerase [Verrucomicrobia bacterium]|nr:triosephosphate isomerase [Verrucomicrobiota bacterium]